MGRRLSESPSSGVLIRRVHFGVFISDNRKTESGISPARPCELFWMIEVSANGNTAEAAFANMVIPMVDPGSLYDIGLCRAKVALLY